MHVCPRCQRDQLVKNGSVVGKPKKRCKQCGHQFTRATPRGKPLTLLRVSAQAVLTWLRALAQPYQEKPESSGRTIVLELDEM